MATSTNKIAYDASSNLTITLASLATSSTWLVGRQSTAVDNTVNKYFDYLVSGKITVGTTPTISTEIRVYVVALRDDSTWPDTFGASDAGVTVTSASSIAPGGFAKRGATISVDATTSNRTYDFVFSVAQLFGGNCPKKFAIFVSHNTAVNLNATGSNHQITISPTYSTSA